MDIKIIYEDNDVIVVDKPAGVIVFPEGDISGEKTLIDYLLEKYPKLAEVGLPPRFGIVHRLDKDTSGILLIAKTNEALIFLQKQFSARGGSALGGINREILEKILEKRYITLVVGNIKEDTNKIETLIGRAPGDKRKQKAYLAGEPGLIGKREAITEYRVLERYGNSPAKFASAHRGTSKVNSFTLLEVNIKTGRRHQIRCHLSYIHHPIAGDKMYGFKDSPTPEGLTRQFLHATYLKIKLPNKEIKEFRSELPEELKQVLNKLI